MNNSLGILFMFKAEDLDTNSHLHGNWNLANAKSRLHTFLNTRKISADFQYFSEGPDHARYAIFFTFYNDNFILV